MTPQREHLTLSDDWVGFAKPSRDSDTPSAHRREKMHRYLRDNVELLAFLRSGCSAAQGVYLIGYGRGEKAAIACPTDDPRTTKVMRLSSIIRRKRGGRDVRFSECILRLMGVSTADIEAFDLDALFVAQKLGLSAQQAQATKESGVDYDLMTSLYNRSN